MISRKTLLQKLKLLKPALANNEMYLVLTCYCFDGRRVTAHNDRIAISTPCLSEFKGCVPGTVLTDVLEVARHVAVVKLFADGEHAVLKFGKAQVKLAMLPIDDFLDDAVRRRRHPLGQLYASGVPDTLPTQNCIREIKGKFFTAVEHCLQSVEINSTGPDKVGVTLIPNGNQLQLFSTFSITASRVTVPLPSDSGIKQRVILSAEFCRAMLRLAKQAQTTRLAICPTETGAAPHGHAVFAADDTLLFGKLIASKRPLDFDAVFASHVPDLGPLVPIPHRRFGPTMKRVTSIVGVVGSEPYTEVSIKDGVAKFHGKSGRGEVSETLALPGHPDVDVRVHLSYVAQAYKAFAPEKILFGERAVVLARGEHLHMVATGPPAEGLRPKMQNRVAPQQL